MIIHSKAPFRIGLAGGGTDVSPYSDQFGGAVLNATLNLYASSTIIPTNDGKIVLKATNLEKVIILNSASFLEINGELDLQKGVYNRIIKTFNLAPLSFELITKMDVLPSSGLGTSSTLVVSIIGAFVQWLKLPLGDHDIAQLAYSIEREDLKMAGGKQDQYAATFGGINFIEFFADNQVIVNPLRVRDEWIETLQNNLILFYTKTSRESAKIIEVQAENVVQKQEKPINAMHFLKEHAFEMKAAISKGDLTGVGELLDKSWQQKKQMANGISTSEIDRIYNAVMKAGAIGGKISGAGGGGFMIIYVNQNHRAEVIEALHEFQGEIYPFVFCKEGLITWSEDE